MKKYYLWGVGIGIFLAFINTYFLFGVLGAPLAGGIVPLVSNCSGEACWGAVIGIGDVLLIFTSLFVAFIIGRFKLRSTPISLWLKNILYWLFWFILVFLLAFLMFGIF